MLVYIILIYIIYKVITFVISSRKQNAQPIGKVLKYIVLEVILVLLGICTVVPALFGGLSNKPLAYIMLIGGTISLIASGRVGVHIRKLANGSVTETSNINPTTKGQFTLAKIFATVSFLALIFAWPFYQTSFKLWAALIYAISLLSAILAVKNANPSRFDQNVRKSSIWGLIIFSCFVGILSIFMLLGIVMNVNPN